jgi:hypothetical protein
MNIKKLLFKITDINELSQIIEIIINNTIDVIFI